MNDFKKYVASTTLKRVDWQNSVLFPPEITKLKQQGGKNLLVIGSGTLVQTLLRHDLVDELLLVTPPLILGGGHVDDAAAARTRRHAYFNLAQLDPVDPAPGGAHEQQCGLSPSAPSAHQAMSVRVAPISAIDGR